MSTPIDIIEYLARSDHRLDVLTSIRDTPRTRDEIRSTTDASRVTVGRIIADLEERGWIVRAGSEYEATTTGRFVATEFTRLRDNLETFQTLPPVLEWLPQDDPPFDLSRLEGATVVTADEGDLIAPIRRALAHIGKSDTLLAMGTGISHEFAEALREAVEDGQTNTLIGPPAMVEAIRADRELREEMRAILESDRTSLFQYEGDDDLPVLQIGDDSVTLCDGNHRSMVETDDGVVYEWATSYFESVRAEASEVPRESFVEEAPVAED